MFNINNMPMSGFEPRTSGIASDRSTNWATTTAQGISFTFGKPTANVVANIGTIYKVAIIWNTKSLQQHFFK